MDRFERVRLSLETISKNKLDDFDSIHILPLDCNSSEDALALGLHFHDRVVITCLNFSEKTNLILMGAHFSLFKEHLDWTTRGFVRMTNLVTGTSNIIDSLELFSNYRELMFEISNIRFLEIRSVPDSEVTDDDKKQALEFSFKLLFDASKNAKKVNNLYCTRGLLSSLRTASSEDSERLEELKFYEQIKAALKEDAFNPKILFGSVHEFSIGTEERNLLQQSVFRNFAIFGDETVLESLKKDFELSDIVFIAPEYRGIAMAGGIATMLTDLCECFQTMGVSINVIIPYYRYNK